ncbi:MAG TPA: YHS domain-containing protein [Candidatus Thermoplasmatota archaeon]|nr:YHS domain-containing protein [Candidatus Thermoplasmatota archaeon]
MGFLDKIRHEPANAENVLDPVCGMRIAPADAAGTSAFDGRLVHFCSTACKRRFDARPAEYAGRLPPA